MLAAKMDLLMKKMDEQAKGYEVSTVNALDSRLTCKVYGNTGHSGNDCTETREDVTTTAIVHKEATAGINHARIIKEVTNLTPPIINPPLKILS